MILVINGVSTTFLWRKNEEKRPILSEISVFRSFLKTKFARLTNYRSAELVKTVQNRQKLTQTGLFSLVIVINEVPTTFLWRIKEKKDLY